MLSVLLAALLIQVPATPSQDLDPALREAVERFFATQQQEDADGYLALWSATARRPTREQLRAVFDSGDDLFADLQILHANITAGEARVWVAIRRTRTDVPPSAEAKRRTSTTTLQLALSFVRQAGAWKLVREGSPAEELAQALIDTADSVARAALLANADRRLVNGRLIDALGRQADPLARQGRFKEAQAIYDRSLEVALALNDRAAEGRVIQNIANALYYQRDFDGARKTYERRLVLERETGNDEGVASATLGIATILYSTHEYGPALTAYRDALAIQNKIGDQSLIATTLISIGNIQYIQGDFGAAVETYRRAESLKRQFFDPAGAASALEGLGRVFAAQGDFAGALTAFTSVLSDRRRMRDTSREAAVLQSIGEIHVRLGNTDAARASLQEGRLLFEKIGDAAQAGRTLQITAINELLAARSAAAEKAYAESIAGCTSAKDEECVAHAQVGLAFALAAQQKYDDAVGWYKKAIDGFAALSQQEAGARARIGLAEALSRKGNQAEGLTMAIDARRTAVGLESDDLLWRAILTIARVERRLEKKNEALGSALAAVAVVRRMAAASLDRPGGRLTSDALSVFAFTAVLHAEAGNPKAAFDVAEEMRTYALRATLAPHERDIARGLTDAEREEERARDVALTTVLVQRDREKGLAKPDGARLEQLQKAVDDATAQRRAWRAATFARLPDLALWRGLLAPATSGDLGSLLDDPATLLLSFVVDDDDVVILAASRRPAETPPQASQAEANDKRTAETREAIDLAAHVTPIERHVLGERIASALDRPALASLAAWRKASDPLQSLIPTQVAARMAGHHRVLIAPHDVLWRVPFEALPAGSRLLGEGARVSYIPSLTALLGVPPTAEVDPPASGVLTVSDPVIPTEAVEALKLTAPGWTLRTSSGTPASGAEGSAQPDDKTQGIVLSGAEATADGLRAAVATASLIHIAAPFRINAASPLFSPVLLTPHATAEEEPKDPGRLETREVFGLSTTATGIVFSDPAALSMRDAASAVLPVAWAWRAAGVRTVIIRRWVGDEEAVTSLLDLLLGAASRQPAAADAFASAQAQTRAGDAGRAPLAWANWLELTIAR